MLFNNILNQCKDIHQIPNQSKNIQVIIGKTVINKVHKDMESIRRAEKGGRTWRERQKDDISPAKLASSKQFVFVGLTVCMS